MTTRRRPRAPRCASRVKVSIRAGENKVFAYRFVCQTSWHLGHIEVRGGNNRTQTSTALCGKDDEIMALCMVTDTEVSFHRSVKVHLGDLLFSLLFFFSLSPCFPHIVTYFTSMLDVFPHLLLPQTHAALLLSGGCVCPRSPGMAPQLCILRRRPQAHIRSLGWPEPPHSKVRHGRTEKYRLAATKRSRGCKVQHRKYSQSCCNNHAYIWKYGGNSW